MANLTMTRSLNQNIDFNVETDALVQETNTSITASTTRGTTLEFLGNFGGENEVITGFTEHFANGSPWWQISGVQIPVDVYIQYASENNIAGLQAYALQGNDNIAGSGGNDGLLGFAGNDVISGAAGSDNINGNAGNDVIGGGKDNDILGGGQGNDAVRGGLGGDIVRGGQGDDNLYGGQGNDEIFGGQGSDIISGGVDNDRLTGGVGADVFVFAAGGGSDVILDFHNGDDRIQLQGLGAGDFSSLASHISDNGGNTVISLSGSTITLSGVSSSSLHSGDFIFA